jgi:hypothetical protein
MRLRVRMRSILLVSLVLNVALGVALVTWFASGPDNATRVVYATNGTPSVSNRLPILKTNVLVRPRAFSWQEIESADYATYVQNLREMGMPEPTIRDIIVADVDQLFIKRKRAGDAKQDLEWWRATPSPEMQSNHLARVDTLEAERAALLDKLLGPDWDKGRADEQRTPVPLTGPVLGNLPDDVKANVQDITARSQERINSYLAERQRSGQPPSAAELARMREETRQQLAAILSPQQLEEYQLRYSETANRLRQELAGMNPTPDEFRSAFRALEQIDRDMELRFSGDDLASQRTRQALEQQRQVALRNALGAERFSAYQTARDPAYRAALAAAQQVGGNEETALALYEIQRATADEASRIRNDPRLSDAQKQLLLLQAEQEQQRARALVLGEQAPEAAGAPSSVPPQWQPRTHVLEQFETLGRLSLRYGVALSALREANPGIDINRARPGTVIVIPPPDAAPLPIPGPGPPYPPGAQPVR